MNSDLTTSTFFSNFTPNFTNRSVWISTFLILTAFILALNSLMPVINALLLPFFGIGLYLLSENKITKTRLNRRVWLAVVCLGFFIAIYKPGGFEYPVIWHAERLHYRGFQFFVYANTSLAIGGYLVLAWFLRNTTATTQMDINGKSLAIVGAVITVVFFHPFFYGVKFYPKLPEGLLLFVLVNIGIAAVCQEAFFRLLVQRHIASRYSSKLRGFWVSVVITAFLFAFANSGDWGPWPSPHMAMLIVAGAGGGIIFALTGRLSLCILAHAGVRTLHFLLLEQPVHFLGYYYWL